MKALARLLPYLARYKRQLLWGVLTVIGSNLLTVAQPLFVGYAVDELKNGLATGVSVSSDLLRWAGLIVLFSLLSGVLTFLTRQTIIVVSRLIEFDLRNDLLAHLQRLSFRFFQNTPTGDLMAHATNDIAAVRNVLGPGIMYPTDTLMTFTMVLVMMLTRNWKLTLLTLIPMPFVSYFVYYMSKTIHKRFMERQEQYSVLTTRAQENLSGIRVVKAYVREEYETGRFHALSWEYLKKNLVLARVQALMWPMMFLLVSGMFMIAMYFGGLNVIDGTMTIGSLTAFLTYMLMLIWPMIAFGWVTNMLQQGAASMERLGAIFDRQPDIRDGDTTDASIGAVRGGIEFRDVTFRYAPDLPPALKNVSFALAPGMTAAFVGHVGSGKTTIINLMARLYDTTEGTVLVDGVDIRTIPLDVLRAGIGMVPQETFLFSESIAENIRYGVLHSDDAAMLRAAEIAQISKDVAEFPKQYKTEIGERGITLSGGQKQRTSIARAVIREPKILILDDALSAVDTYTEEEILRRLRAFMEGRTSIIISHRISTVKDADVIFVLDHGAIAERGTHDELVALGGIYADLNERQLLERELDGLS